LSPYNYWRNGQMNKQREAKESRLSPKLLAGIIVALFFGIALCFRICLPYDQVFSGDWIKFTGVDAYYHMRLIDNLIPNFPHLISTDPYMLYPDAFYITRIHLFDWLLAGIIRVISLGSPTQHTIDVVSVYFPAVLGALTVIPVYFIGKEIFNRWVGVISAALIAVMPGEFLGRSILGFTDHDVAGTLFTTVTIMFLIMAVKAARQRGLNFSLFRHGDRPVITRPIVYSLLSGIFLGLYLVTWEGALLFVLIIFAYFVVQYVIDHLRKQSTAYLCPVGVITFLVAL
jgi:asparagine N-glycosylation enzyme membrane subunit Stt3